jgi:hypothetical protein
MSKKTSKLAAIPQPYPRIREPQSHCYGCLDTETLVPHPEPRRITPELLKKLILQAIHEANAMSSREALEIPPDLTPEEMEDFYRQEGRNLFEYFHDYPVDPAATAHDYYRKSYRDVGLDLFRNRAVQKGRMNSGWRYQLLARDCAKNSGRFDEVAGFGNAKGDFIAKIQFAEMSQKPLHIYISVKNRSDTLGGQDWPNSIAALETYAKSDNSHQDGPYICVFGIAMDRGIRRIPRSRDKKAHSENTEIWLSDFFWPFFSAHSYEEIMTAVLDVLVDANETPEALPTQADVPEKILYSFGAECRSAELIDDSGVFNDPFRLVRFFCSRTPPKQAQLKRKQVKRD